MAIDIWNVKMVNKLFVDKDFLGFGNAKLLMDRGFYSKENVYALYQNHLKFLMAMKVSLKYVQEELDKVRDSIRTCTNYNAS